MNLHMAMAIKSGLNEFYYWHAGLVFKKTVYSGPRVPSLLIKNHYTRKDIDKGVSIFFRYPYE